MRTFLANSRLAHFVILALPFLLVIAACGGLSRGFPTYQSYDEAVHFQIVGYVAHTWPRPMLSGYYAWSGPFVYWLLATLALPFGASLTATRLVVAVLSWATCAVAYVILRDRLGARPRDALFLSLLLAVSPFFFGQSFRVLTDNPTWLFVVLALERLLAFVQRPRLTGLVAFAACAAAATIMRQVSVWLFLPGLVAVLAAPISGRRRLGGSALLALGMAPLVALVVFWGGALPPGTGPLALAGVFRIRNVILSLAVVGLYGVLLIPIAELSPAPTLWRRRGTIVIGAAAGLSLMSLGLHAMRSLDGGDPYGMGILARTTVLYPTLWGTSILWWLTVPVGAVLVAHLVLTRTSRPRDRVLVAALAAVLLSAAANVDWYQRYVDFPIVLVFAALAVSSGVEFRILDRFRWAIAAAISFAWALLFVLAYLHPS
jgi:hypothetical protein